MAKLVRLHDPGDAERRVTTVLKHDQVPETLEFLATLPYGSENAFIRGLIHQWVLAHKDSPTLDDEIDAVLNGPGGRITTPTSPRSARALVREKRRASPRRLPAAPRPAIAPAPTAVSAQPAPIAPTVPAPPDLPPADAPAAVPAPVAAPAGASMVMPASPAEFSPIAADEENAFFASLDDL
jgi:hypothetical protein